MEYKIGQIFEIDDLWYQFVEDNRDICKGCVFYQSKIKCTNPDEDVKCSKWHREDGKDGHFVRLLPIGDVYEQGGTTWQQYKCIEKPNTEDKRVYIANTNSSLGLIVSIRLTSSNGIERKIGEIFNYDGEWYQCVEEIGCDGCAFDTICDEINDIIGNCTSGLRHDDKSVVFKKLEKVGKPFKRNGYFYQEYKTHGNSLLMNGDAKIPTPNGFAAIINKEDMETTISKDATKHSNLENIGKNLKPFDLEAAKSGKPVCTRDGRKARIICFDKITRKNYEEFKIIALVRDKDNEDIHVYNNEGRKYLDDSSVDLMMLPEKKSGWVNLYRDEESKRVYCGESIFSEREKAEKHYECNDTKVATVSIGWEE